MVGRQVEGTARDEANNKGGYRFKVRIVGDHPGSKEILDTKDLPWANVMMPVNVPFMPGNGGGASVALEKGCWVVGFYLDNDKQTIDYGVIRYDPWCYTNCY